jgi:hypothetical protein
MTDQVNFFAAQFSFILGASIANQIQLMIILTSWFPEKLSDLIQKAKIDGNIQ